MEEDGASDEVEVVATIPRSHASGGSGTKNDPLLLAEIPRGHAFGGSGTGKDPLLIEQDKICSICLEVLDYTIDKCNDNGVIYTCNANHEMHIYCLEQFVANSAGPYDGLKCPECREKLAVEKFH